MRTAHIPDVFRPERNVKPTPHTVTASERPVSPFSNTPLIEASCGEIPVFVDQTKRIVIPRRRD